MNNTNTKKRILMCGESSHLTSGFGIYTKELLSRLYATNKYEIAELSCYRDPACPKTEPWKIYPVSVLGNDPLYQEYISSDNNQFGQWRFEYALIDFKPHIVFDVRDFWNFTFEETSSLRQFYHWIIAPTYDSSPPKIETLNTFKNADKLLFHTDWAKNDITNNIRYNADNIGPVVNDSVDPNIFKPIGYSKKFHKNKYGISSDSFIIGTVMRNQKRKLIPDLLSIFSNILKENNNVYLYLHTSYPDGLAWDLPSLLLEYGVVNNVLFTYKCKSCGHYYPSIWKSPKTVCKNCLVNNSFICGLTNPVSNIDLNNIYNLFDTYVQYAICEGFGIPTLEAATAGVPIISIDFGAMGDVGKNVCADLVPVIREFREQETNALRCYPDNSICEKLLLDNIHMSFKDLNAKGKLCRQMALNNFSWDKTAKVFEEVFDSIDITKKLDWNCPQRAVNNNHKIDDDKNNRRFIYSIVDNIINEPWLKETNFIEELIKSLDDGYIAGGNKINSFNKQNAIKILELYMNNKSSLDFLRKANNINILPQIKSFIEYSKK